MDQPVLLSSHFSPECCEFRYFRVHPRVFLNCTIGLQSSSTPLSVTCGGRSVASHPCLYSMCRRDSQLTTRCGQGQWVTLLARCPSPRSASRWCWATSRSASPRPTGRWQSASAAPTGSLWSGAAAPRSAYGAPSSPARARVRGARREARRGCRRGAVPTGAPSRAPSRARGQTYTWPPKARGATVRDVIKYSCNHFFLA